MGEAGGRDVAGFPHAGHATATDGTRVFYELAGPTGAPAALLLQGIGVNGRMWAPAAAVLHAAGWATVTVDARDLTARRPGPPPDRPGP